MQKINQTGWDFFPRNLSQEEINDPYLALQDFFQFINLPDSRKELWEWIRITICDEFSSLDAGKRSDLLLFYEYLGKLIEASYLIKVQHQSMLSVVKDDTSVIASS